MAAGPLQPANGALQYVWRHGNNPCLEEKAQQFGRAFVDRFEVSVVRLGQHEQCAPVWKLSMETLGVTDGDGGIEGAVDEEDRCGASTDRVKRRELAEPIPDDVSYVA